jgi:hypothetical protein
MMKGLAMLSAASTAFIRPIAQRVKELVVMRVPRQPQSLWFRLEINVRQPLSVFLDEIFDNVAARTERFGELDFKGGGVVRWFMVLALDKWRELEEIEFLVDDVQSRFCICVVGRG